MGFHARTNAFTAGKDEEIGERAGLFVLQRFVE
jgi:hypothetical protein